MATAKQEAQKTLGNIDLGYLDNERKVANDIYSTSKQSLQTNYNNLLNEINQSRADNRSNFTKGRNTIAEQSFDANRLNNLDVGSRVAGNTGLKTLGQVGNRIETGRQYSNVANEFYNDMGKLDTSERQSGEQFNLDNQGLTNTYNQALAGIGSRGAEATNSWNQALATLAEQIQGRRDSNANAQASLAQQRQAANQAEKTARDTLAQNIKAQRQEILSSVTNANVSESVKINMLTSRLSISPELARNILLQMEQIKPNISQDGGWNRNTNYLSDIGL